MWGGRNYSVDFLRIISMLFIVFGHYQGNTEIQVNFTLNSFEYILFNIVACIQVIGVNLFIIISAWFLFDSKFELKKLLHLLFKILIYSVGGYVFIALIKNNFDLKLLLKYSFPVYNRVWWYATEYIRFYLVFVFLNVFINKCPKTIYKSLIYMLTITYSIYPTLMNMTNRLQFVGNWHLWFITIYLLIGYIKKYDIKFSNKSLVCFYISCTSLCCLCRILIDNITVRVFGQSVGTDILFHNNSIFVFLSAFSVFLFFYKISISNPIIIGLIKKVSPLTFDVYLFHMHPMVLDHIFDAIHYMWSLVGINNWTINWIPCAIASTGIIFFFGCLVDSVVKYIQKMMFDNRGYYNRIINIAQNKIDYIFEHTD